MYPYIYIDVSLTILYINRPISIYVYICIYIYIYIYIHTYPSIYLHIYIYIEQEQSEEPEQTEEPEHKDSASASSAALAASSAPALASSSEFPVYFVGYDREQRCAWRALPAKPSAREFTNKFEAPPGSGQLDPITAVWKDGYRGIIVDLTVEEFHTESQERGPRKQRFEQKLKLGRCDDKKAQKKLGRGDDKKTQKKPCGDDKKTKKPRSGKTRGTLWCGEMQNGEKLKVAVRPDRLLPDGSRLRLCSLYITPASSSKFKQVCQLAYSNYGEEQHPIVEDVMKTLALEFSTGSVLKQDLSKRRNAIMLLERPAHDEAAERCVEEAAESCGSGIGAEGAAEHSGRSRLHSRGHSGRSRR